MGRAASEYLNWINSAGGPLVLLQESLLPHWSGDDDSDYDRACRIDDYLGLIGVGPGEALVLGEEPFRTCWLQLPEMSGGTIVRWVFAPSEAAVLRSLSEVQGIVWSETNLVLNITTKLLLFDAVCPGSDPDCLGTGCLIVINLEPGEYSIETARFQPDKETSLILHRMRPMAVE